MAAKGSLNFGTWAYTVGSGGTILAKRHASHSIVLVQILISKVKSIDENQLKFDVELIIVV